MSRDNKGRFAPGNSGRRKGSKNLTTTVVRERILEFLNNNYHRVQEDFDLLDDPKDRLNYIFQVQKLILPKVEPENAEPKESKPLIEWV